MAHKGEITKITLPNGDEYDIKDSVARAAVSAGFSLLVVEDLPDASDETTGNIYLVSSGESAENNNYIEYVTVFNNGEYSWEQIGTTSVDLSDYSQKDHTHTVTTNVSVKQESITPVGTVSQPVFSGTEGDISVSGTPHGSVTIGTGSGTANYTPSGTISGASFSGTVMTSTGNFTPSGTVSKPTITANITDSEGDTLTAYSMDSAGSYTPSSFTNGSYTASQYTPESYSVTEENLIFAASQYTKESVTMPQYTRETVVLPTRKQMKVTASSSTPSFTGTQGAVSVTGTPSGDVTGGTFTGTGVQLTAEFTGSASTATGKFTPVGTVSQPTFTGTAAAHTHEVTNTTVTSGTASK